MLLPGWELAGALTGARSAPYNKIHGYEVWEVHMNTILDTKPYMLYETVGMLVKYVNRISMLEVRDAASLPELRG